ncbi:MAG TPA: helix-turn-helix domain-containing protein [Nocardioidaceae bacterium]|nr:helix-turn-helix domain-containing protein [Nocardioidaceae bacterium]
MPVELLGEYLHLLAEAAVTGRRATREELEAVGRLGRRAAEQGFSAGRVVDLYLSAALRLWQQLPEASRSTRSEVVRAAAEAVLRVVDEAVATLAEGYAESRRQMVRREETLRRELIDDLIRGDADVGGLVERSEPFGLDLATSHRVALASPGERLPDVDAAVTALERVVLDRFGDRDVLVAAREGVIVVLTPAEADAARPSGARRGRATRDLGALVHDDLSRLRGGGPWQVTVGRAYPGAYGIARSYEEAREALTLAARLHLDRPVLHAQDLLVYRVLVRDQPAIIDLVGTVLGPLTRARGGAAPLLDTLEAYFAAGGVATIAARRLHLSVRAVTYRLDRVRTLTGYDPADPEHRFALHAAVLGAKLLGWPVEELPVRS